MTQPVVQPPAVPVAEEPPPPKLFTVALTDGEMWQLGGYVPGSEATLSRGVNPQDQATYGKDIPGTEGQQALRIVDMISNDDGSVDVWAAPVPGSEFDKIKTATIFTLYAQTIRRTLTVARFDVWKSMMDEANNPEDDDDDLPDDPDEPEEPTAGALPAAANGAPAAGVS